MANSEKQKKKSTFWSDFRAFIAKGNVIDMAVGVVIGSAFSKIVSSLVGDLITPLISLLTGKVNLSELFVVLNGPQGDYPTVAAAQAAGCATLNYGMFLQSILDFLLVAFSIFLVLRLLTKSKEKFEHLRKKEAEAAAPEEKKPTTEELLTEIRDLLKKDEKAAK